MKQKTREATDIQTRRRRKKTHQTRIIFHLLTVIVFSIFLWHTIQLTMQLIRFAMLIYLFYACVGGFFFFHLYTDDISMCMCMCVWFLPSSLILLFFYFGELNREEHKKIAMYPAAFENAVRRYIKAE